MAKDPTGFLDILGGVGSAVGGLFGLGSLNNSYGKAREDYDRGIGYLRDTDWEAQDAWRGATENQTGREAQLRALGMLGDVASSDGMDAASIAALDQSLGWANQNEQAHRQAVTQRAQMRNTLGSGAQMASELVGQQGAADRGYSGATEAAGQGRMRALQAMRDYGTMGSAIRGGDFDFQNRKLSANNAMNTFNAMQRGNRATALNSAYQNRGDSYVGQGRANYQGAVAAGASAGGGAGGAYDLFKKG